MAKPGLTITGCKVIWNGNASAFRAHIRAARECGKPLIIHTRSAAEDTLRIMREENAQECGGDAPFLPETWEVAQRQRWNSASTFPFSGIVTFKNATQIKRGGTEHAAVADAGGNRLPYLAPVPFRGKLNHPALVKHVAEHIRRSAQAIFAEIAAATTDNFFRLFPGARPPHEAGK